MCFFKRFKELKDNIDGELATKVEDVLYHHGMHCTKEAPG